MALIDYLREVAAAIAGQEELEVSPDTPAIITSDKTGIPMTDDEIKHNAALYEDLAQDYAFHERRRAKADPEIEAEVEAYRQRRIEEKRRESQASSAKESDAG